MDAPTAKKGMCWLRILSALKQELIQKVHCLDQEKMVQAEGL
jgi:hypothetical protein